MPVNQVTDHRRRVLPVDQAVRLANSIPAIGEKVKMGGIKANYRVFMGAPERHRTSKKAISTVIATAILTGVMLTIVSVALFYSTSLIDMNRQTMEYEYAKEQLTYAATALEQVAFGTGGSRYVRFSLTSTRVSFKTSAATLEVLAYGVAENYLVYNDTPRQLEVCGGPLVTTVPRLLYPESGSLETELGKFIVGGGEPLVVVYENFTRGACAFLMPRLRAFFNGQINVTIGNSVKRYNYFVLHIVKLTYGRLGGSGTIPVVFRNINLKVFEYVFQDTDKVTITASLGENVYNKDLEGPPADGSVLIVKIATIEISTG